MNAAATLFSLAPILVLVVALVVLRLPAWKAALAAFVAATAEALAWKGLAAGELVRASAAGASVGLYPIGLVIVAALFAYAVTVESGAIEEIKKGLLGLSEDRRFFVLLTAWGFGNFMEGMAGFGTAVAIPCAILVGVGFDPLKAVLCCLVANTTPTAFGSVGVPTAVLASETAIDPLRLSSATALLQLAVTALSPFLILFITDGVRGVRERYGLALVADAAFLLPWLAVAATLGHELPNIAGGLCTMLAFALMGDRSGLDLRRQGRAWLPFGLVVAFLGVAAFLPARARPSAGVTIAVAALAGGMAQGLSLRRLLALFASTARRYVFAVLTICTVLALAKVMSAAGMTDTLAKALVAATGRGYAAVSAVVGALGGFVTGSGTSTNVLFGALQASVGSDAFEKTLFAAANVMGAGIGKMVCPQSIVLGCAAAGLAGRESEVMKRALPYFLVVLAAACASAALARLAA